MNLSTLLLGKKKSSVEALQERSNSIFDVFTQTQKDCETLNAEIDVVVTSKTEEITALQAEVSDLNAIKGKNTKLSDKIGAFLNE